MRERFLAAKVKDVETKAIASVESEITTPQKRDKSYQDDTVSNRSTDIGSARASPEEEDTDADAELLSAVGQSTMGAGAMFNNMTGGSLGFGAR